MTRSSSIEPVDLWSIVDDEFEASGGDADASWHDRLIARLAALVDGSLDAIPCVNDRASIDDALIHRLVRFRGILVQNDQPEYYLGSYRNESGSMKSGLFRDSISSCSMSDDVSDKVLMREQAILRSIPGLTTWAIQTMPDCQEPCCETCPEVIVKFLQDSDIPPIGSSVDIVGVWSGTSIHCVWERRPALFTKPQAPSQISSTMPAEFLSYLTDCCAGDDLVAQHILLHMISTVHSRPQGILVGKLALNIRIPSEESVKYFSDLYRMLLPQVVVLPLSIDALNAEQNFNPRMDYESNRIIAGPLQLANGTVLILDQTKMSEGTLTAVGLANLQSLIKLATQQTLAYNFFYDVDIPVDLSILVLSTEAPLVRADVSLKISPDREGLPISLPEVDSSRIDSFRDYLATARAAVSMVKVSEDSLSELTALLTGSADDMHCDMNLGRLICASQLKETFDKESLVLALTIAGKRKSRSSVCL